jgi:hypothetical protein
MNYFNKIPTIIYDGQVAKNLLARAKLSDKTMKSKGTFYPYTMDDTDRADTISQHYYEKPGYTWLIWMANNIIDPYYSLALTEDDFNNHIISKYGSQAKAMRKIAFYRTKFNSETRISVSQYSALTPRFMKYYEPVLDAYGSIIEYRRKVDKDITNTNKIITLTLSNVTSRLTVGEEVQVDGTNYAFVTLVDGSTISCQHVNGTFASGDSITAKESGITATVVSATTIIETIAFTDAAYWEAISYYDYERELNEDKKEVNLLDVRYKSQAESELKRLMSAA